MEQLWNFAWPSAIALLHPSLLPVAVMGFIAKVCSKTCPKDLAHNKNLPNTFYEQLAIIAGGPLVGKLMDSFPRLPAYNFLNTLQVKYAAMAIHSCERL